ncbi:hypothetical protein F5051DRAFT_184204 [Lentinula edodes]|nr:hypothetical protein F5051DRAFT_184204 [Lentinula edodes]
MWWLRAVRKYCRMRSNLGFTVSCLLVFVVFYFSDDLNFYWRCEASEAGGIGVASENGHGVSAYRKFRYSVHTQLYSLFYIVRYTVECRGGPTLPSTRIPNLTNSAMNWSVRPRTCRTNFAETTICMYMPPLGPLRKYGVSFLAIVRRHGILESKSYNAVILRMCPKLVDERMSRWPPFIIPLSHSYYQKYKLGAGRFPPVSSFHQWN